MVFCLVLFSLCDHPIHCRLRAMSSGQVLLRGAHYASCQLVTQFALCTTQEAYHYNFIYSCCIALPFLCRIKARPGPHSWS